MTTPISGTQYSIAYGDYTATIASIGASLRKLAHAGRDLVVPFEADELRPGFRGATLAPWPNRVADGKYTFEGTEYQVPLTEPERGNALHGLVAWIEFVPVAHGDNSLTLAGVIEPQAGYPWRVLLSVENTLTDAGLATTVTATNLSKSSAPYGTGPHPYLVAGPGRVDAWTLELPAATVLEVTADRLLPTGTTDVASAGFDWHEPRVIGDTFIDHAFCDLTRDETGTATVRLTTSDGSGVAMTWGTELPWVQVHTADRPIAAESRLGLAVEPMTCPPDAFNSGTDLIVLEPNASTSASWTISAI